MIRKIDAMHMLFGTDESGKCADCPFLSVTIFDRRYYKCDKYGDSRSEATDWAKRWTACGLFHNPNAADKLLAEWGTVLRYMRYGKHPGPSEQIEGQMSMEDFL